MTTNDSKDIKWIGYDTTPLKEFTITVYSPDFRSNEPETFTITAPNKNWAALQAISLAWTGNLFDPQILSDISDSQPADESVLDNFPQTTMVTIDQEPEQIAYHLISKWLHDAFGISI